PEARERTLAGRLGIAEWLLKHREYLITQIEAGHEVQVILADLLLVAILPTAFYGLVTGLATGSWVRILTNPIKLPLVLIFSMCLCLPTLYIFSSYLGSRRSFLQTAALGFTGLAITGVILAAFAPITWFLTFTAPGAYALHVLVNVAVLALSGCIGVRFMFRGLTRLHQGTPMMWKQSSFLWGWMALYGLVGAQMGWLLCPFFSNSDLLISHRGPGSESVFQAIFTLIPQLFR
ncbi:MAG: actin-binding protein, partial [Armatimonadetes bacterium]|nr:actin-binding protein [Armatimonadota bacterium]